MYEHTNRKYALEIREAAAKAELAELKLKKEKDLL